MTKKCVNKSNNTWVTGLALPLTRAFAPGDPEYTDPDFPSVYKEPIVNKTMRAVAKIHAVGDTIRLRFRNQIKDSVAQGEGTIVNPNPVTLELTEVWVARRLINQEIIVKTNKQVFFNGGETSVKIIPGGQIVSDDVDFDVDYGDELLVSIYVADSKVAPSFALNFITNYISLSPGNFSQDQTFTNDPEVQWDRFWLSGIDVNTKSKCTVGTILCMGDSITEGTGALPDAFLDYPTQLANRLKAQLYKYNRYSVVNLGIGGNKLTSGNNNVHFGGGGIERITYDVLAQTNVKYVILLEGTNDIGTNRSADTVIATMKQFALLIKAFDPSIKLFISPITPRNSSGTIETSRRTINAWIRSQTYYDAVIDFDTPLADPLNTSRLNPIYATDNIHPNYLGYSVMANAIPLSLFK
jgi:lysophospholipase L1-like esterase